MVTDAEGMPPAAPKSETSDPDTLPAEAWPCHLSTFHSASGEPSGWTVLHRQPALTRPGLATNKQQEISVPYLSNMGWGRFRDGSLRLDPAVAGQGLFPAATALVVSA
jgi:hypothetical protein